MTRALLAALLAALPLAPCARAQTLDVVRRRDVLLRVQVTGTVEARGIFRLKSTIDGRIEEVRASTGSWRAPADVLATLSSTELAAMLDARGSQDKSVMLDRWGKVYRPTPIRCPDECYVLRSYLRPKSWVRPQAVLFEAARGLTMIAHVRAEDVEKLHAAGLVLTYWTDAAPENRRRTPVTALIPDSPGEAKSAAHFEIPLSTRLYFPPGTAWSGEIIARVDHDVLAVPSAALIKSGPFYYLPVRVQTGLTADGVTEILSGVEEGRPYLLLDDTQLHGAERGGSVLPGSVSVEEAAPAEAPAAAPKPAAPAAKPAPAAPPPAPAPAAKPDFGDDPYAR
ncbi:MAG: hypothetical protein HKL90_11850 [Elusimicrobia bacterium]|nr:hypothetical protein [Elusimicrobiota bacterium]